MADVTTVGVDQLIVGRRLTGPIHDQSSVLLLAAGTTITVENIRRIKARGVKRVLILADDAKRVATSETEETVIAAPIEDQAAVNERLASLVLGGPAVVNTGPSLCQSVVRHGRKNLDPATSIKARKVEQECEYAIDQVTSAVANGKEADGSLVMNAAEAEVEMLKADLENTLSIAFESSGDSTIAEHALKNALLGMSISIELGLDLENTRLVGIAGFLQNLGMSHLPPELRFSNRPMTLSEQLELQKVPRRTLDALEQVHGIPNAVRSIVYQVFERPDGTGFPRGLTRQSIHFFARTLQVSNSYAEMTSATPQKPALMPYAATQALLYQASVGKVDATVVRMMLQVTSLYPIGSFVTLSDSSVARVIRANGPQFTQPIVARTENAEGEPVSSDDDEQVIDLVQSPLEIVQALPTPGRNEVAEITTP